MVTGVWSKRIQEANDRRGGYPQGPAMGWACLVLVAVCGLGIRVKMQVFRMFASEMLWHVHGERVATAQKAAQAGMRGRGFDTQHGFGPRAKGWDEYMRSTAASGDDAAGTHGAGESHWQEQWFSSGAGTSEQQERHKENARRQHFRARAESQRASASHYELGMDHHRKLLGVRRGASRAELKAAYYKAAKQHHPDANAQSSSEQFASLKLAYEALKQEATF